MGAENDDYNKASIYSILYGLYANAGEVICGGSACGAGDSHRHCRSGRNPQFFLERFN